jgi:hypothetical protein
VEGEKYERLWKARNTNQENALALRARFFFDVLAAGSQCQLRRAITAGHHKLPWCWLERIRLPNECPRGPARNLEPKTIDATPARA